MIVRRGLADVLEWLGEEIVPGHTCNKPFWRFEGETVGDDTLWTCPICGRRYKWVITLGAVPGVPAAVCTVYHKEWVLV